MILSAAAPRVNLDSFSDAILAAIRTAAEARPTPEPTGPTAADDLWWAEQTRDDAETADADWDAMADASAAVEALAAGYCHA